MRDLTGKKFGRWTIVGQSGRANDGSLMWICLCQCDNVKSIVGYALRRGTTKSCGCLQKELLAQRRTTHGQTRNHKSSKIYEAWRKMIGRCNNPANRDYSYYGARGISVCDRWIKFENFIKDMGQPPSRKHMIDRIDNNGNYCKSNCRWTTIEISNRNKRGVLSIPYCGITQCVSEWANAKNINEKTLRWRLNHGWSIEKALIIPVRKKRKK